MWELRRNAYVFALATTVALATSGCDEDGRSGSNENGYADTKADGIETADGADDCFEALEDAYACGNDDCFWDTAAALEACCSDSDSPACSGHCYWVENLVPEGTPAGALQCIQSEWRLAEHCRSASGEWVPEGTIEDGRWCHWRRWESEIGCEDANGNLWRSGQRDYGGELCVEGEWYDD